MRFARITLPVVALGRAPSITRRLSRRPQRRYSRPPRPHSSPSALRFRSTRARPSSTSWSPTPKAHPVHGLKQSDFTISEDGKEMSPRSFEEHRADSPTLTPSAQPTKLDLGPNTFTNYNPAPTKSTPVNILVLDSLNTSTQVQQIIVKRMLDYVDGMPLGTQFSIMRLTTSLSIIQGFTSDRELLRAALTDKKNLWIVPPLADLGTDSLAAEGGEDMGMRVEREGNSSAMRGEYEMAAMRQIARYTSGMPGRKNLLWFTGSFPLQFPPLLDCALFPNPGEEPCHRTPGDGRPGRSNPLPSIKYNFEEEMKSATDLLSRSHVSVYPIDGRGLGEIIGPRSPNLRPVEQQRDATGRTGHHGPHRRPHRRTRLLQHQRGSPKPSPRPSRQARTSTPSLTPQPTRT